MTVASAQADKVRSLGRREVAGRRKGRRRFEVIMMMRMMDTSLSAIEVDKAAWRVDGALGRK